MKVLLLILVFSIANLHAGVGSISGSVSLSKVKINSVPVGKYRGKISGRLSPPPPVVAGVWLESDQLSAVKSPATVTLSQKNYQFERHLIVIAKGTKVRFPNKDPDFHNIYSLSKPKRFDIGRYKRGETPIPEVKFDKLGFVALNCEIHDHMKANIIVVDSPYMTTTDQLGKFSFKNIPEGNYTLHAQMSSKVKWQVPIRVEKNKVTPVSIIQK